MIKTNLFGEELQKLGFSFYTGVPCSFLKNLINYAIKNGAYIAAVNEGDAMSIAAGSYIGGKKAVVMMQNSGLTNALSPLTSLNYTFQIPVLGFVSLRGEEGLRDEPQHELTGRITTSLLELIDVKWEYLSSNTEEAVKQLHSANNWLENNQSFFFVVKKGTFEPEPQGHHQEPQSGQRLPSRYEALKVINTLKDKQTILLASTGKTGRELHEIEDSANNFYMVGSMGCASSLGLGLALVEKDKSIIVIDGDGALLMRLGNLTTNGNYKPPNLLHILLDNQTYDSTGGQATVSSNVNFVDIAFASGYPNAINVYDLKELKTQIEAWQKNKELTFLYLQIARGSKENLGRPNIKPYQVKKRLRGFISGRD